MAGEQAHHGSGRAVVVCCGAACHERSDRGAKRHRAATVVVYGVALCATATALVIAVSSSSPPLPSAPRG